MQQDCLHCSRPSAGQRNYLHRAFILPLSMQRWRQCVWGAEMKQYWFNLSHFACLWKSVSTYAAAFYKERTDYSCWLDCSMIHIFLAVPVLICSSLLFNYLLLSFKTLLYFPMSALIAGGGERKRVTLFDLVRQKKKVWNQFFDFIFSLTPKILIQIPVSWGKKQGELPQGMGWNNYLSRNSSVLWGSDFLSHMWFLWFLSVKEVIKGWLCQTKLFIACT